MTQSIATANSTSESGAAEGSVQRVIRVVTSALSSFKKATMQVLRPVLARRIGADVTKPLDIDMIAAHLDVDARARQDAREGLPTADEAVASGMQREIVSYFRELQRKAQQKAVARRDKLNELGDAIDIASLSARIREEPAICEDKVHQLYADAQFKLDSALNTVQVQQARYAAFREANNLQRPAAPRRPFALSFAFVFSLIVAGAVAIDYLADQAAGGAATGIELTALIIATVVVAVTYTIGASTFRSINHVGIGHGILGLFSGMFVLAFTALAAFLSAHYIYSLPGDPGTTIMALASTILADPFAISGQVPARLIMGAVGVTGLLAFLAGYEADDKYPGYGATQRALERARDEHERIVKKVRKRIGALVNKATKNVVAIPESGRAQLKRYSDLLETVNSDPSRLASFDVALEDACIIVLNRYRTINRDARDSVDPPSFSENFLFRAETSEPQARIDKHERRLRESRDLLAHVDEQADQAKQQLRNLHRQAIDRLDTLDGAPAQASVSTV